LAARQLKGSQHIPPILGSAKIVSQLLTIDHDLTLSRVEPYTGYGSLSPAYCLIIA
jgi:hypothetical protein